MAKLGSYYGLCPLIDNKSLFGISEDSEKGFVIATLGKNIASRYKFSDQKQICSWRTKDKFNSPVTYSKKYSKYVAVFNQSFIRLWDADEENLDKVKKYKFSKQIHTIISDDEETFVLFQNGSIYSLDYALEQRKTLIPQDVISDNDQIDDVLLKKSKDTFYIGLIINGQSLYWTKYNAEYKFSKIKLTRDGHSLCGYTFHPEQNTMNLLTLWSDGRIYCSSIEDSDSEVKLGELFAVLEIISTKHTVSMLSLDENYVAMYGANCNEEGAMLIIYNTQFKVTQSKQSFKLFTEGAKMWCVENNLILPVGQNLAVVPFYLETEQLAALVGSHKIIQNDLYDDIEIIQEVAVGSWHEKYKIKKTKIPESLRYKINEHIKQGLPESLIIEELLPDIFKKHDIGALSLCIRNFSDIPEKYLAKILKYLLDVDGKLFGNQLEDVINNIPSRLQPLERSKLIDQILSRSFSEVLLLPYLRSELTLSDVLLLLDYICLLLSKENCKLPFTSVVKTEVKLLNWSCALIDSNYQKFLLSNDASVTTVLSQFHQLIQEHLKCFEYLSDVTPLLIKFKERKFNSKGVNISTKYSVEQLNLY